MDELTSQKWILEMIGDEVAVVMAVFVDFADRHKSDPDPETKSMIAKLQQLRPKRVA